MSNVPVMYLVNPGQEITGAFVCAQHIALALKGRVRVVLVLYEGHRVDANALEMFWKVEVIAYTTPGKRLGALLRYVPALCTSSWRLKRMMKRDGAQHLWFNDFYLIQGPLLRLLGFKGQLVSYVRCHPDYLFGRLGKLLLALSYRAADRLVTVSDYISSVIPPHYKAVRIYDYIALQSFDKRIWDGGEKQLIFIGNYIQGKGQDVALQAFAKAYAQDTSLRLSFYGSDMGLAKNTAYHASLLALAERLGVSDAVTFHGFTNNTQAVLAQGYAALSCSRSESFSMTVLEATAMGLPVIATASGGPQEIVIDGVTGLIVQVDDVDALAQKILQLAAQPEQAKQMGEAGAVRAREVFSEVRFREQVMDVLGY